MLNFRIVHHLANGRTHLDDVMADSADQAWGIATRLARRLGARTFSLMTLED